MLRLVLLFSLFCTAAFAQVNPGTSPLSGKKGGTNNAFMQFSGPATSMKTYTLPNASTTLAALDQIQTWTGAQSFGDGKLILLGSSSGSSTIKAPATGGGTATLFSGSDTIAGLAVAQTLTNKTINGANNTLTARIASDVSGLGTGIAAALANSLNASGGVVSPTPTRAGDLIYWNGSTWVSLAGNNSGTQFLQENSSGLPSWVTVSGTGTVTSLTAGYGVAFSSGSTCTTSCTVSLSVSTVTNSLGADVSLSNVSNYFDGPSIAQGTTGTWWASGTVAVNDLAGSATIFCKLWDGTTIIASAPTVINGTGNYVPVALSGFLASPAANIRISCRDTTSTSGKILFNQSGNSKDSTISAHRIQ